MEGSFIENTLRYERNGKIQVYELPRIHPSLEVFQVDPSHPCFPGKGLRVR